MTTTNGGSVAGARRRMSVATLLRRADWRELHCHVGLWALISMGIGGTGAVSAASVPPDSGSVVIECGALIDGLASRPRGHTSLEIRNGRVAKLHAGFPANTGLPRVNLRHATCLPGLIDMHTHLTLRPEDLADISVFFNRTMDDQARISRGNAEATLQAGFTTVRDVGTYLEGSDIWLRDAVNRGEIVGPRMQVAGPFLTIPGGGGDVLVPGIVESQIPQSARAGIARGPEEFAAKSQRILRGSADLLKVIASGAILAHGSEPGAPEMTPPELAAVVRIAHAAGIKVAAHAHGSESILDALRAGVDTIEHASLIDEEGLQLARAKGVPLGMDLYQSDYIDIEGQRQGWPADFLRKNAGMGREQRKRFERACLLGVPMVFASDAGVFPHGENARQFSIMVAHGMSPMSAIQSATSRAAQAMGWSDAVGTLAEGRWGDVIAIDGDPLADVSRLERVIAVFKGGVAFRLPEG